MNSSRFVALACLMIVNAACSNGPSTSDASTEGGPNDAGNDAIIAPDAGDDSAPEAGPFLVPFCTPPADAGSGGSCVTIAGDVMCNPITNAPCAAGDACDFFADEDAGTSGFQCYVPPPANSAAVCAACDDQNTACMPTATCVTISSSAAECARFCCVDGDCGSGHCDTTTLQSAPVGVCVQ